MYISEVTFAPNNEAHTEFSLTVGVSENEPPHRRTHVIKIDSIDQRRMTPGAFLDTFMIVHEVAVKHLIKQRG